MKEASGQLAEPHLISVLIVFVGAVLYSSKAIFIKLAYQYDVDSVSLVALRMAFSLPFFTAAAWWSRRKKQADTSGFRPANWLALVGLGLIGYYVASLLDFWALQYLPAGLARLILFTYPTLVLLLSALFLQRPVTRLEALAVFISYIGIFLAFAQTTEVQLVEGFWWGVALSFGSAFAYAIYLIGSGEYLPRLGTLWYTSFTMSIACLAILIHHGIVYRWALFHFPAPVYWLCIGMALLATVLPSFMVAEGIRRIGAGPSSIISSFGPISTIILAYIFLGEAFGPWQWLGAVLVIVGVWVISRKRRGG